MNIINLNSHDLNQERLITACHQLANASLRPLAEVRVELARLVAEVRTILDAPSM